MQIEAKHIRPGDRVTRGGQTLVAEAVIIGHETPVYMVACVFGTRFQIELSPGDLVEISRPVVEAA